MISTLKQILHSLLAPIAVPLLYVGAFVTIVASIFRKAEWGLFVLVVLIPMPNIWYKFHGYPLGKDLIDLLVFSVILGIFINKQGFTNTKNSTLLIIVILINYIATWNSSLRFDLPLPVTTNSDILRDWKNYAEMIFLYFLVLNTVKDEEQQHTLIVVMTLAMLFIFVREFRNFTEGAVFDWDKRSQGPFWVVGLGSNHFGAFIAHYSAILLGLFLFDANKKRRILYVATYLFGLHGLFFSYSRGAYLGALAVLVFIGLVKKRSLILLVMAIVMAWETVLPVTVVERVSMTETSGGQLEASAEHRIELWELAKSLFQENPVFGVGYEGFSYSVSKGELTDTHNFYMKMLSEEGVIGFSLFLLMLMRAFVSGFNLLKVAESQLYKGLGLGFMGCVVAESVTNLFGDRWSYFPLGGYFFVFWGLVDRCILTIAAKENPQLERGSASIA